MIMSHQYAEQFKAVVKGRTRLLPTGYPAAAALMARPSINYADSQKPWHDNDNSQMFDSEAAAIHHITKLGKL